MPVSGLQYPEANAIHLLLATREMRLVSAYLAPTRPLIESHLKECLSGRIPVVMAGDLNAEHKYWNSRLTTSSGSLLGDYADRNSCLIYGPDWRTTAPYTHNSITDVLDIVIAKDFVLPAHLTGCPSISSDHLPIQIYTPCRSSFHNLTDLPDFTRIDWAAFQACLEDRLPGSPLVVDEIAIDECLVERTSAIHEATASSVPSRWPRADTRPPLPDGIHDELSLKNRLRR
jgi:hypothetical protein